MCLVSAEVDTLPSNWGSEGPMDFFLVEIVPGRPEVPRPTYLPLVWSAINGNYIIKSWESFPCISWFNVHVYPLYSILSSITVLKVLPDRRLMWYGL